MEGLTFLIRACGIVVLITLTAYMVFLAILFSKIMLEDYMKEKQKQEAANDNP